MKNKHTELPWEVCGETNDSIIIGKEIDNIAYIPKIHPEALANAAFIVKACNRHLAYYERLVPELVAALERIVSIKRLSGDYRPYDRHDMAGAIVIAEKALVRAKEDT